MSVDVTQKPVMGIYGPETFITYEVTLANWRMLPQADRELAGLCGRNFRITKNFSIAFEVQPRFWEALGFMVCPQDAEKFVRDTEQAMKEAHEQIKKNFEELGKETELFHGKINSPKPVP